MSVDPAHCCGPLVDNRRANSLAANRTTQARGFISRPSVRRATILSIHLFDTFGTLRISTLICQTRWISSCKISFCFLQAQRLSDP
ncbi:hypothetical protein ACW9YV_29750 (plasmid) [Paraburkholderia strydomiana]